MSDGIENEGMSLADIAGLDVSDVQELRSAQLAAGLYVFEVGQSTLTTRQITTKDGDEENRYVASIPLKVIEVNAIAERGVEESDVMGKTHTETYFIDPSEAEKGIGYLKGFVTDIGCDASGALGGLPEDEQGPDYNPGFLDKMAGHRFPAKIIKKKGRDGEFYSRLQLIKQKK